MPLRPKPLPSASGTLDRISRTYMIGHQLMNKKQLQEALHEAQLDPELKGALRNLVIERYKVRISGGTF